MRSYVFWRLAAVFSVLGLGAVLPSLTGPLSDLIGVEDGIQFFLAALVFIAVWGPAKRFFTEYPPNYANFLSLGIAFWASSFMLASVWSVTWRAFGYSLIYGDNWLRFGFRYLAVCGSACVLAAPELFDTRQDEAQRNLKRLGVILVGVLMTVMLLVYGSRLGDFAAHDTSPTLNGGQ